MDSLNNLKEALSFSPNNIPLKLHYAQQLSENGLHEEAHQQYLELIDLAPDHRGAKIGLASICFKLEKYSTSIVILEELVDGTETDQELLLLYTRVLLKDGAQAKAVEIYKRVLASNPQFEDEELDAQLRLTNVVQEELMEDDSQYFVEKPKIGFSDVGGMERVKEEIELKIIKPLKFPDLYKAYGKKMGGGILLYGPPGCGKTHLAKATAGEVNAEFINIGINDILDMYIGNSEKNLHEVFEIARRNKPCVLFFDEVDALGASRSDMRQSSGRHLINQFLAELDGVEADNDGVLVLAATNAPWHLDSAFRRPGRFDRIIFVEPPNVEGKVEILKILLKDKPTKDIDYITVAKKAVSFSGADLRAAVDICIEEKLMGSFKSGLPEPITTKDLVKSVKRHKPSTKEWFSSAKNYALYANDSGLYDDILTYMKIKK